MCQILKDQEFLFNFNYQAYEKSFTDFILNDEIYISIKLIHPLKILFIFYFKLDKSIIIKESQ